MRAKQIQELVGIVEKSNIDEIEVTRWWGQKVRIRKDAGPAFVQAPAEYVVPAAPAPTPDPVPEAPAPVQSA